MTKQAYRVGKEVRWPDYEIEVVVFATSPSGAMEIAFKKAAYVMGAETLSDLRAKRESWADQYAEIERIPIRAFLENGWTWDCYACDEAISIHDVGGIGEHDQPLCERCAARKGITRPEWAKAATE